MPSKGTERQSPFERENHAFQESYITPIPSPPKCESLLIVFPFYPHQLKEEGVFLTLFVRLQARNLKKPLINSLPNKQLHPSRPFRHVQQDLLLLIFGKRIG